MISLCIKNQQPFGVVLIKSGEEALAGFAEPYSIGCTAQISEVQKLAGGKMNISALGQERFKIISLDAGGVYLIAEVEDNPLIIEDVEKLDEQGKLLQQQLEKLIVVLMKAGGEEYDKIQLPEDPVALAYIASSILQIPPLQKQILLEFDQASDLLSSVRALYRRELALLKVIVTKKDTPGEAKFSVN